MQIQIKLVTDGKKQIYECNWKGPAPSRNAVQMICADNWASVIKTLHTECGEHIKAPDNRISCKTALIISFAQFESYCRPQNW